MRLILHLRDADLVRAAEQGNRSAWNVLLVLLICCFFDTVADERFVHTDPGPVHDFLVGTLCKMVFDIFEKDFVMMSQKTCARVFFY